MQHATKAKEKKTDTGFRKVVISHRLDKMVIPAAQDIIILLNG
jgi:hypothetical protein